MTTQTTLLTVGTTVSASADFTVEDGESVTLALSSPDAGARVLVQIKDPDGGYTTVGGLSTHFPAGSIHSKGTYRVSRQSEIHGQTVSCGVFLVQA